MNTVQIAIALYNKVFKLKEYYRYFPELARQLPAIATSFSIKLNGSKTNTYSGSK